MVLSETELRVADLAAAGVAVEMIADALGGPPEVAAGQLRAVYRKLGGVRAGHSESP